MTIWPPRSSSELRKVESVIDSEISDPSLNTISARMRITIRWRIKLTIQAGVNRNPFFTTRAASEPRLSVSSSSSRGEDSSGMGSGKGAAG